MRKNKNILVVLVQEGKIKHFELMYINTFIRYRIKIYTVQVKSDTDTDKFLNQEKKYIFHLNTIPVLHYL